MVLELHQIREKVGDSDVQPRRVAEQIQVHLVAAHILADPLQLAGNIEGNVLVLGRDLQTL